MDQSVSALKCFENHIFSVFEQTIKWKYKRLFRNVFNVHGSQFHLKELNVFLSDSGYENGNYQGSSNKQKISNADVFFLS